MRKKITTLITVIVAVAFLGGSIYYVFPKIFADSVYPLPDEVVPDIVYCADLFGLDKPLLAGLIKVESNFNQRAISHAGASGYAQLMPATFAGLMKRAPELQGLEYDIFNPRSNICAGAAYLAGAMANYGGDWTASLISYNGGDGAARRYLAAKSASVLVDETRLYAPKILSAREYYAANYADALSAGSVKGATATKSSGFTIEKESDKLNSFWKSFLKDAFAKYIS
jgi:soluble lytic murein transglycosylase-like protein